MFCSNRAFNILSIASRCFFERVAFGMVSSTRRAKVNYGTLLGRSLRDKSSHRMAFPHPKSRKGKYRNEDKPSSRRVVWDLLKRTINITDYRNGKDDVNPAEKRTFGSFFHD